MQISDNQLWWLILKDRIFISAFCYDQSTMQLALNHISPMKADMGGTEILEPLSHDIDQLAPGHKEVRIVLLTYG